MRAIITRLIGTCPACTRYIGSHQECPYCGIESPNRSRLRALQITAITLSLAGLVTLLLVGRQATAPLIAISRLIPVMNHGHVTLIGTVLTAPNISGSSADPKSFTFTLADPSGQILITATQRIAKQILAHNGPPVANQRMQVTGTLYLAAGRPARMYLDSAPLCLQGIATP